MRIRWLLSLGLIGALSCAGAANDVSQASDSDYRIYSLVIQELYVSGGWGGAPLEGVGIREIVIQRVTSAESLLYPPQAAYPGDDVDARFKDDMRRLEREWPALPESVVAAFIEKAHHRTQLETRFHGVPSYTFADPDSVVTWTDFYRSHPTAPGIITFSRVAFNRRKTQALVHVENQRDSLWGDAQFVLLEKQNGKWVIVDRKPTWVS